MTPEDLEIVIARTGHAPYRWLVSDANPDVESRMEHRRIVAELAAGTPPAKPPSLVTQAVSVTKAAARFVASGCATVDQAEFDRRHAICEACEHFDAAANRCGICSCNMAIKPWMRDIECPIKKW
jgi:hypothetical protein